MAAEFFGTCQICGRAQKAHPNAIAKHGYTIRFGWQMGACYGSNHKPYEISNDRILSAIESAQRYIVQTKEKIAALQASPYQDDGKVWGEYSEQRFGDKRSGSLTLSMGENGRVEAKDYHGRVVYLSGTFKEVAEAARSLADRQISSLTGTIRETEAAIPYMQKRYDDWKPAELRPVSPADREANKIKVHFEATKFGRKTGVCVSSAQASTAYKQTTTDRSKVTCAACLKELARIDDLPRVRAEREAKELASDIKRCESNIKEFQKLIKREARPEVVLSYTADMNVYVAELEKLKARVAPAAQ